MDNILFFFVYSPLKVIKTPTRIYGNQQIPSKFRSNQVSVILTRRIPGSNNSSNYVNTSNIKKKQ